MGKGYVRLIEHIAELMSDGKVRNTMQIYDYLKKKTKDGTTTQALGNILSKMMYKQIEKVGIAKTNSSMYGKHKISQWRKREVDIDGTKKKDS